MKNQINKKCEISKKKNYNNTTNNKNVQGKVKLRAEIVRRNERSKRQMPGRIQKAYLVRMSSNFLATSFGVLSSSLAIDFCLAGSKVVYCSHRSPSITF